MTLKETAPPDVARLPLAELRDFLRMGRGFADDTAQDPVLEICLRGAMRAIEARLSMALLERDHVWTFYLWRGCGRLGLPVAPVGSLAEIRIVNAAAEVTVLSPASYQLGNDDAGAFVNMVSGSFPYLNSGARVEIDLTAGFGEWAQVPADLQQAWLRLAGQFYDHRNGSDTQGLPLAVLALIEPYLPRRTGARR